MYETGTAKRCLRHGYRSRQSLHEQYTRAAQWSNYLYCSKLETYYEHDGQCEGCQRTRSARGTRATSSPSNGEWTLDRTVATAQRNPSKAYTSGGKTSGCGANSCSSSSANFASKNCLYSHVYPGQLHKVCVKSACMHAPGMHLEDRCSVRRACPHL